MEFPDVPDLIQLTTIANALVLPVLAGFALLAAKFTHGETARWAERQFYMTLVIITLITLRTVIVCDPCWLLHTTTLGTMIIGALVIPSCDAALAS